MIYKKKWPLIIFLLPSLIFLIVFLYIPFFNNIKNSLFDMTTPVLLDGQVWKFIGIDNYRRMLTDPDLRIAIWNSLKMMFLTIIFQVGIAFILAVLVSNIRKMQQFFRKVFDLPWVLVPNGAPQGLTHFLGTYMYQSTFGMNNYDYGSALAVLIVILGIVVSRVVNTIVQPDKDR